MPDTVIEGDLPWNYYIVRRPGGTATGNVYLGGDLIYRCDLEIDPEDYGYDSFEDIPDSTFKARTQAMFAHTLWGVLYEAQPKKERGQ